MDLLLFIISVLALAIITTPLLKRKKLTWWTVGAIIVSNIAIAINGNYTSCEDGWASSSIGKQGACSWHGGVVTRLNDFGWAVTLIGIAIIIIWYMYISYQVKKEEKEANKSDNT